MQFYDVARILSTHGLNGEIKVALITDFPKERFAANAKLSLKDNEDKVLTVEKGRPFKQFWLVQFKEVTTVEEASELKDKILVVSQENQQKLPAGSYYYRDILNSTVIDAESGEKIGTITDIQSPGANDVWQVTEQSGKEYLIPYIPDVVKKVDVANKKVYVKLLEGLRDED